MKPAVTVSSAAVLVLMLSGGAWASGQEAADAVSVPTDRSAVEAGKAVHHGHHSNAGVLSTMAGHCIGHAQHFLGWLSRAIDANDVQANDD